VMKRQARSNCPKRPDAGNRVGKAKHTDNTPLKQQGRQFVALLCF